MSSTLVPLADCGALDIAHGDGAPERGREAARRDLADDLAAEHDLRAFARDRLAFGEKTDALARRALGDLLLDDRGAGEAALHATFLADAPQENRLDGRGGGVDVVAVEAEAGFEAQRIARAQADRLDLRLGQKLARDGIGGIGRRRDLEAVAAGVARTRDVAARAVDHDEGAGHEFQARDLRREPRQRLHGQRTLQGQKPAREHRLDLAGGGEVLLQVREVGVLAGGVDHQQEMIAGAGHHQIVEDAAALVGELGVALLAGLRGPRCRRAPGSPAPWPRCGRAWR